jgi:hypothetical protein
MFKRSIRLFILIFLLVVPATASPSTTINTSFNINLNLVANITITTVQGLLFPDQTITGSAFNVTVATGDSGAASFNATGSPSRSITASIVQSSINMSASGVTGTIAVDTFVIAGPTAFNSSGSLTGLKVGATAHVLSGSQDGNYSGTVTLSITYQ